MDTQDTLDITFRVSDRLAVGQTTSGLHGASGSSPDACGHILLAAQDLSYPTLTTVPVYMHWAAPCTGLHGVDLACWILGRANTNHNWKERLKTLTKSKARLHWTLTEPVYITRFFACAQDQSFGSPASEKGKL